MPLRFIVIGAAMVLGACEKPRSSIATLPDEVDASQDGGRESASFIKSAKAVRDAALAFTAYCRLAEDRNYDTVRDKSLFTGFVERCDRSHDHEKPLLEALTALAAEPAPSTGLAALFAEHGRFMKKAVQRGDGILASYTSLATAWNTWRREDLLPIEPPNLRRDLKDDAGGVPLSWTVCNEYMCVKKH